MTTSNVNVRAEEQIQELLREQETDPQKGLSDTVARNRLRGHGLNQLLIPGRAPPLLILWAQLRSANSVLLAVAGAISAFMGEVVVTQLIVGVGIAGIAARFWRQYKAEEAAAPVSKLTSPVVQVIRCGRLIQMRSVHLVPGDVVRLRSGDHIPADGRLIEALCLSTQEAALTGEVGSVEKNALHFDDSSDPVGDRRSAVFMGTSVVAGRGTMVVVRTGTHTELGALAASVSDDRPTEASWGKRNRNSVQP